MQGCTAFQHHLLWMQGGRPVILGLWGMGGVGKTTLGLGLFGYLSRDFLHVCIVDDFCEEVKRCGIIQVQQCMLKDLFHRTEQNLHTKGEGKLLYILLIHM